MPGTRQRVMATHSQKLGLESRHTCHCGKAYLRPEHLRRHMLTHSQGRHQCHICTRCFSRNDSLQRHITLHGVSGAVVEKPAMHAGRGRDLVIGEMLTNGRALPRKTCTFSFDIVRGNPKLPSKDPAKSTADQRNTDADEPTSASAPACGSETSLIVDHAAAGPDIAKSALHLLFEVVNSSSSDLQKTLQDFEVSVEVMTWFEAQCQAHSEHLHHRWPVIHYTSFEIMSDPIVLVAIVILLGCQIRKESCPGVLEVHSALTMSLCHHLLSTKFVSDEAWDFGLFQAMHLTTLFAFLSKSENHLKQARLLFSLVISSLRNVNFFSAKAMEQQEQHHFPATFMPYQMLIREKWRRLVVNLYKLDTYLAIQRQEPPLLNPAEIEAELPLRFSLWNTRSLDIFYERFRYEPTARQSHTIKRLIIESTPPIDIPLFPEDVELGLCGMLQQVWTVAKLHSVEGFDVTGTVFYQNLISQLESWRVHLENISAQLDRELVTGTGTAEHSLLRAYKGKDDCLFGDPGEIEKARVTTLILDARVLYERLLDILKGS